MFWFYCYPHKSVLLLQYPQKTVIVWIYPQKRVSLKKYPQMSEKGLGLPIYEIKPIFLAFLPIVFPAKSIEISRGEFYLCVFVDRCRKRAQNVRLRVHNGKNGGQGWRCVLGWYSGAFVQCAWREYLLLQICFCQQLQNDECKSMIIIHMPYSARTRMVCIQRVRFPVLHDPSAILFVCEWRTCCRSEIWRIHTSTR